MGLPSSTHRQSLEECPDLEGIETKTFHNYFQILQVGLEECPDLEGIETFALGLSGLFDLCVWRSAPT